MFPLRFPKAVHPYELFGARVLPLPLGHVRLRRSPRLWLQAIRRITNEHRRRPFDIVHALHGNEAGAVAVLAGRRCRIPAAVHLGGGELSAIPHLGYGSDLIRSERLQVRTALALADLVTTGSTGMAQRARERLPTPRRDRVRVAALGIDVERFVCAPPSADGKSDRLRLISVAELNPVKDHATLLDAYRLVLDRRPRAELHLVGGGPTLADLRRQAHRLSIERRIRWWGQIPPGAVPFALARADVFVHASRHEGQGMVFAEAAAAGLPIASTGVGMAADMPAWAVSLAESGDAEGLAAAIEEAARRQARWTRDTSAAGEDSQRSALRAWAAAHYARHRCALRWLEIYRERGWLQGPRPRALA